MDYTIKSSISAMVSLKKGKFPDKAIATKPSSFSKIVQKGITVINTAIDNVYAKINASRIPNIEEAKNVSEPRKLLIPESLKTPIFTKVGLGIKISGAAAVDVEKPAEEEISIPNETKEENNEQMVEQPQDPINAEMNENIDEQENSNDLNEETSDLFASPIEETEGGEIAPADENVNENAEVDLQDPSFASFFDDLNSVDTNMVEPTESNDLDDTPTVMLDDNKVGNFEDFENTNMEDSSVDASQNSSQIVEEDNNDISNDENVSDMEVPIDNPQEEVAVEENPEVEENQNDNDLTSTDNIPSYNNENNEIGFDYVQKTTDLKDAISASEMEMNNARDAYSRASNEYETLQQQLMEKLEEVRNAKNAKEVAEKKYNDLCEIKQQTLNILSGSSQMYNAAASVDLAKEENVSKGM